MGALGLLFYKQNVIAKKSKIQDNIIHIISIYDMISRIDKGQLQKVGGHELQY